MTTAWPEVALGEVTDFVRGVTFKPADVKVLGTPGTIACLRTANVQAELAIEDVWAIPEEFARRPELHLRVGDVVVSSANSWNLVGKCSWVDPLPWPATFGGFVTTLRARPDRLDARYLYRWFSSPTIQTVVRSFGRKTTNISNLNLDRCRAMLMPLPPVEEQQRIAAILDAVDELRAKRRESLRLLDTLTESMFLDMFGDPVSNPMGWPKAAFGDVLALPLRNGVSPSSSGTVEAKVLTLSSITGARFDGASVKTALFAFSPPSDKRVSEADFLICRGNGNRELVGRGRYPTISMPDIIFPDTVIATRPDPENLDTIFLEWLWQTRGVRRQIESKARTTNGTHKVNQTMIESVEILVPPVGRQRVFAATVRQRMAVGTSRQNSECQLDALFSSLQYRAFRGEL